MAYTLPSWNSALEIPAAEASAWARGRIETFASMPVMWPEGRSLAKLVVMEPEPHPTSKIFR